MARRSDRAVLQQLFSDWGQPLLTIEKQGGQTNQNYKVLTKQGGEFFVRLPWERGDVVDRVAEGKNIKALLANKKIASLVPQVFVYVLDGWNILNPKEKIHYHAPNGAMVSEYIEGREFAFSDFRKRRYQNALANLLHQFHVSGVRFLNSYNVFEDEVRKYRLKALLHPCRRLLAAFTIIQLIVLS